MKMYIALSRKQESPEVYDILKCAFTKSGAMEMLEDNFARVAVVDVKSVAINEGDHQDWIAQDVANKKDEIQAKIASAEFKLRQLEEEASSMNEDASSLSPTQTG